MLRQSVNKQSDTSAPPAMATEAQQQEKKTAPPPSVSTARKIISSVVSVTAVGLVQLLGKAGKGATDPFIAAAVASSSSSNAPVTILQTTAAIASAIQIVAFIPSYIYQTEKFYDITGTMTYVATLSYSLVASHYAKKALGSASSSSSSSTITSAMGSEGSTLASLLSEYRAPIATACVAMWAVRLGSFLFTRILQDKKDGRFDAIKPSFFRFSVAWNVQGLWVFLGCLPTLILNASSSSSSSSAASTRAEGIAWTDIVGLSLFAVGFVGEVIADHQKRVFNNNPANKGIKWIESGLWKYSRHPNYFFEWTLQFGLFLFASRSFEGSQWVAVLSPCFVAFLLLFVSGIPLLEKRADEKWGGNPRYEAYKARTSMCIPMGPLKDGERNKGLLKLVPKILV